MSNRELNIVLSDQVREAMAGDAELATAMQELFALMHQAHAAVNEGRYPDFESAMSVLTGEPVRELGAIDSDFD